MDFDGVVILTASGEKKWTWEEFVRELKDDAAGGDVQIVTTETVTTVCKGTAVLVFAGEKEVSFWRAMELHGWHSGMHPRVIRRNWRE